MYNSLFWSKDTQLLERKLRLRYFLAGVSHQDSYSLNCKISRYEEDNLSGWC